MCDSIYLKFYNSQGESTVRKSDQWWPVRGTGVHLTPMMHKRSGLHQSSGYSSRDISQNVLNCIPNVGSFYFLKAEPTIDLKYFLSHRFLN
jgi:hypothetical protein